MFKKLKNAAKRALSSKPIKYRRKVTPIAQRATKRMTSKPKFRQYGDRGYRPSDGRGVGY